MISLRLFIVVGPRICSCPATKCHFTSSSGENLRKALVHLLKPRFQRNPPLPGSVLAGETDSPGRPVLQNGLPNVGLESLAQLNQLGIPFLHLDGPSGVPVWQGLAVPMAVRGQKGRLLRCGFESQGQCIV